MMRSLHRRIYAAKVVLRDMQMRFLPSLCAERGPVADTDLGTVGKGRGGASLTMCFRFGGTLTVSDPLLGSASSSLAATGLAAVDSLTRFRFRPGKSDSFLRLEAMVAEAGVQDATCTCLKTSILPPCPLTTTTSGPWPVSKPPDLSLIDHQAAQNESRCGRAEYSDVESEEAHQESRFRERVCFFDCSMALILTCQQRWDIHDQSYPSPKGEHLVPHIDPQSTRSQDQISRASAMLTQEYGTASNIKSRVNRLSVLAAITSTQQRLKLYNRVPPNGLVLFVGTILTDEGKEKKVSLGTFALPCS